MDPQRYEKLQALLTNTYGPREQWSDECYNELIDFKQITKDEHIQHKNKRYYDIESYLCLRNRECFYEYFQKYSKDTPIEKLDRIHQIYRFTLSDVNTIFDVLARAIPKVRTITLHGASNCGKSLLANALLYPWAPGYIQRDGGTNVHWLEHIYRKSFILWEEPSIHLTNIEDTKLLCGGEKLAINRKNKNIIERINDPAVIITTNREIWQYDPEALQNRMVIFRLNNTVSEYIKDYIEPREIIKYLCVIHDGRL